MAIQETMSNVESIMEEKNKCDLEINGLSDELQAANVMLKDMKLEKEEIVQKMNKALEDCKANEKNKLTKLESERKASVESMLKDHSSVVEELKKSKSEALELLKLQHAKRMADLLAAKEEEHKQSLARKEKHLGNVLVQKEGEIKAAYSEKVNFRYHNYICVVVMNSRAYEAYNFILPDRNRTRNLMIAGEML